MAYVRIKKVPGCLEVGRSRSFSVPVEVEYEISRDEFVRFANGCSGRPRIVLFAGGPSGAKSPSATIIPIEYGKGSTSGLVTVSVPSSWYEGKHNVTIFAKLRVPYGHTVDGRKVCDDKDVASDTSSVTVAWGVKCEEPGPGPEPGPPSPQPQECKEELCAHADDVVPCGYGMDFESEAIKVGGSLCVSPSCIKPGGKFSVSLMINSVDGGKNASVTLFGPFGSKRYTIGLAERKTLTFTAPAKEGKYTVNMVAYIYREVIGIDGRKIMVRCGPLNVTLPIWVTESGSEGGGGGSTAGCTKEEFINGMVNNYKNSPILIGWADDKSPILDVSERVKRVLNDDTIEGASLTIYGNDPSKLRVLGPYDKKPPDRSDREIVNGWLKGEEWERQKCPHDKKYYWVIYPAYLQIDRKPVEEGAFLEPNEWDVYPGQQTKFEVYVGSRDGKHEPAYYINAKIYLGNTIAWSTNGIKKGNVIVFMPNKVGEYIVDVIAYDKNGRKAGRAVGYIHVHPREGGGGGGEEETQTGEKYGWKSRLLGLAILSGIVYGAVSLFRRKK